MPEMPENGQSGQTPDLDDRSAPETHAPLPESIAVKQAETASTAKAEKPEAGKAFTPAHLAKRERRWGKPLAISASVAVCLLLAAWLAPAFFFQSHFGPNSKINGINASFQTVEQVDQAIAAQISDYQLTLLERQNRQETISGSSIRLTYLPDDQVQKLLDAQQPFLWFVHLYSPPVAETIKPKVSLDEKGLAQMIDNLRAMNPDSWQAPRDAQPVFRAGRYEVQSPDLGTTVDPDKVRKTIEGNVRALVAELDLDKAGCYLDPAILQDNQELLADIALYNQHAPFSITYALGEQTELLDASTAITWFSFAEDDSATLNEDALLAWVADFAARHDTAGTERSFTTADGKEATVAYGTYGWLIDQEAEVAAIKEAIAQRRGETREPHYLQTAAAYDSPDWGNTYVEINLTTQYLYYVVKGQIVLESDVVTGAPWGGRSTPPGVYDVLETQSPSVLRGNIMPNGKPEYITPVSYWMRVTWGGIGMHDATWQPWFGGNRYTYAGSHGCINMPWGKASELYGMLEVGTPVILHY
jgi:hypothetical protein